MGKRARQGVARALQQHINVLPPSRDGGSSRTRTASSSRHATPHSAGASPPTPPQPAKREGVSPAHPVCRCHVGQPCSHGSAQRGAVTATPVRSHSGAQPRPTRAESVLQLPQQARPQKTPTAAPPAFKRPRKAEVQSGGGTTLVEDRAAEAMPTLDDIVLAPWATVGSIPVGCRKEWIEVYSRTLWLFLLNTNLNSMRQLFLACKLLLAAPCRGAAPSHTRLNG